MSAQYRLGIDAGGTFTDFVIADKATGETKLYKTLSTPSDPTKAIEDGVKLIAEDLRMTPEKSSPTAISASTGRRSASMR